MDTHDTLLPAPSTTRDTINAITSLTDVAGDGINAAASWTDYDYLYEVDRLLTIASSIYCQYIWVISGIGLVVNALAFITVLKLRPVTPAAMLVAVLLLADSLALTAKLAGYRANSAQFNFSRTLCRLMFLVPMLSTLVTWVLADISVERFLTMWYPQQVASYFNKKFWGSSLLISALLLLGIFCPAALLTVDVAGTVCVTPFKYAGFINHAWNWTVRCLYVFIPFICMALVTLISLCKFVRSNRSEANGEKGDELQEEMTTAGLKEKNISLLSCSRRWYFS